MPLLVTPPGFGWINAYTVASEIGDIALRIAGEAVRLGEPPLSPTPAITTASLEAEAARAAGGP
jgi:hypothetical protein